MAKITKAKKGGSFDLNKDGKTTFKDVLIGRGVLPKTAKKGMKVEKAQAGKKIQQVKGMSENEKVAKGITKLAPFKKTVTKNKTGGMTAKKKMNYGGAAASMKPTMNMGGMMKKGGKMTKKCKYGCK